MGHDRLTFPDRDSANEKAARDSAPSFTLPLPVASTGTARGSSRRASIYGVIACQGDSLTFGSRDPDGMSYPLYLGRQLSHKHKQTWATVNLGVPGDGWPEIWRRNYQEILALPEVGEICLWAGTNDAKQGRSLEQTLTACEAVLDQCRALGRVVYLATLPGKNGFGAPVEPWSMNEMIETLNEAYRRIAQERGLVCVDLAHIPREHFVDGIHLTQSGNVWVAERFAAAIEARR
jgi:lysophospholipase L1-like esterase